MKKQHWSWSEVSQMQRVWLCLLSSRCCEESCDCTEWREVTKMQQVWIFGFPCKHTKSAYENTPWRVCNICPSMFYEEYTVKRKSFEVKSHKCNQCEYISDKSSNLTAKRNHLNEPIGNVAFLKQSILLSNSIEKSYKRNHCE